MDYRDQMIIGITSIGALFWLVVFFISSSDFINEYSGYYSLVGCCITALATVLAVYYTNKTTRRQWTEERKNNLIVRLSGILSLFFNKIDNYFELDKNKNCTLEKIEGFMDKYGDEYQELSEIYYELLETYDFKIDPLTKALGSFNYILKYLEDNKGNKQEIYTIPNHNKKNGGELPLLGYFPEISQNFLSAKREVIKIIRKAGD